jgi:hypothetical protein
LSFAVIFFAAAFLFAAAHFCAGRGTQRREWRARDQHDGGKDHHLPEVLAASHEISLGWRAARRDGALLYVARNHFVAAGR